MKTSIIPLIKLMVLAALTSGCGDATSDCLSHAANGVWENDDDVLLLSAVCRGESSYCDSEFSYDGNSIEVTTTNSNTGCPQVGNHTCSFDVDGDTLAFNCGVGTFVYTRFQE